MNRKKSNKSVLSSSKNHDRVSSRRRSSSRRLNSTSTSQIRRFNRTSTPISSPLAASRRSLIQIFNRSPNNDQPSSIIVDKNESDSTSSAYISPSNALDTDVSTSPKPFDVTVEMENIENSNTSSTTRSGKLKKAAILSYFTLQTDGRYECNLCQSVSFYL